MTDELINQLVGEAANLRLFFAGQPEDKMRLVLCQIGEDLKNELVPQVGTEIATLTAEAFVITVARVARGIEAAADADGSAA